MSTRRNRARIGIDVGGTFTDFALLRGDGTWMLDKAPTTPADPSSGLLAGLEQLARREECPLGELLGALDTIVHGTTTADNTLVTRSGALTGLLTTQGHRDEIELRGGFKEDVWNSAYPPPFPICQRRRRIGIPERLDFRGNVVVPLDEAAVRAGLRRLKRQGIESLAVVFLFSFVNSAHEDRVAEIVREEWPEVLLTLSHEIMPSASEFERTSTTLVHAYLAPQLRRYVAHLEDRLREAGFRGRLLMMQSSGGVMAPDYVARRAVTVLGSGSTAGVVGARHVGSLVGVDDFVAASMGGTSYDVCIVRGGAPQTRSGGSWRHRYAIGLTRIDVESVGAGGGSIARVEAGTLKIGPQSAGAEPGPICYGRGGAQPTVTDADLVLGYLDPDTFCAGRWRLRPAGVGEAILHAIGRPLGLSLEKAAHGIFRLANASMADAIRRVAARCDVDPRELALLAYGGSAPIHAPMQAEELGLREIVIPKAAPVLSALGLLLAGPLTDELRSYIVPAKQIALERVNSLFEEMEGKATAALANEGTVPLKIDRFAQLGYADQAFELMVPVAAGNGRLRAADVEAFIGRFHEMRENIGADGSCDDDDPVLLGLRVRAVGLSRKPELPGVPRARGPASAARKGRRRAYFEGSYASVPVYEGSALRAGHKIRGPAIVEEPFTTVIVHPGHRVEIDARGNYRITLG